jgi:hypothetical protein
MARGSRQSKHGPEATLDNRYLESIGRMSQWATIIRKGEIDQGYTLVEEAPWFNRDEWLEAVISKDPKGRIRLVLLDARLPGNGAFTRLISEIQANGLTPVIVEPIGSLAGWCKKHGWRKRLIKQGTENKQEIWYAR